MTEPVPARIPHVTEDELLRQLEEWEAGLAAKPSIFDAVRSGNSQVLGGYVLRSFRAAAKEAVEQRDRVLKLRNLAYLALPLAGDAERFLRSDHPLLGTSPLAATVESWTGLDDALRLLAPDLACHAGGLFQLIRSTWALSNDEATALVAVPAAEIREWSSINRSPDLAATRVILLLLTVYWVLPTLHPTVPELRAWLRACNYKGDGRSDSPLHAMMQKGPEAIVAVRRRLLDELESN